MVLGLRLMVNGGGLNHWGGLQDSGYSLGLGSMGQGVAHLGRVDGRLAGLRLFLLLLLFLSLHFRLLK